MKGRHIILGTFKDRTAAALYVDGILEDLLVDSDAPRPGTVFRAKVTRTIKGQGGVFLETPEGSAFLRNAKGLAPGDMLLVQVSGYAEAGKAIPVTDKLLFKSRYAIVTPEAPGINLSRSIRDEEERLRIRAAAETEAAEKCGYGIILRSACEGAPDHHIEEDVDTMVAAAGAVLGDPDSGIETLLDGPGPHDLAWRDWGQGLFENGDVEDAMDEAQSATVKLASGAHMSVETTRALVAVDVNTGSDTSLASGLKANLAAARALPRSLRTRGLGGQIVIDFAPMPKKERQGLENVLRAGLRQDDVDTALVGWTRMGLFELTRKRARVPLSDVVSE